MKLTIGMPSYDNTAEVWWTCQVLRAYHDLEDVEIIVVDNYGSKDLKNKLGWMKDKVRYIEFKDTQSPAHAKNKVFEEAKGDWVMCIDSHIFFLPDTINKLKCWIDENKESSDLYQGPLLYDNLVAGADCFSDVWSSNMWGQWSSTGIESEDPYEIKMMGCGLLLCRKDAWLGFSKNFKGFGAEEGYIHEKFRQAGRKAMCIPWLKWVHYFRGPEDKVTFEVTIEDRIHNYVVAFSELNLDMAPIKEHFKIDDETIKKHIPVEIEVGQDRSKKISCICPTYNRTGKNSFLIRRNYRKFY